MINKVYPLMEGSFVTTDSKGRKILESISNHIGLPLKPKKYFLAMQAGRDLSIITYAKMASGKSNEDIKNIHTGEMAISEKLAPIVDMNSIKDVNQIVLNSVKPDVIKYIYNILFDSDSKGKGKRNARDQISEALAYKTDEMADKIFSDDHFKHIKIIKINLRLPTLESMYGKAASKSDKFKLSVIKKDAIESDFIEGVRLPTHPVNGTEVKDEVFVKIGDELVKKERVLIGRY
ncbi:MAG: hypothetical protein IBX55_01365 [Methyloprofundus sp.]|nr:hypothetical protein [Methyloprofundus sp.]